MGTFGGGVFGGAGGSTGTAGVALSTILQPMLRIAGIACLPNTTPGPDEYAELVPLVNRLLESWNLDGHKIFSTAINQYPLTTGLKTYTFGPTGALVSTANPLYIKAADILFPTSPVVRRPMRILSDIEWSRIAVQDVSGAPSDELYYDNAMDANGNGTLYLRFQPPAGYILELYTWNGLQASFVSPADIAIFPAGYGRALVLNGALEIAEMYPREAKIAPTVERRAMLALQAVMTLNMDCPKIGTEPGINRDGGYDGDGYGWLAGPFA